MAANRTMEDGLTDEAPLKNTVVELDKPQGEGRNARGQLSKQAKGSRTGLITPNLNTNQLSPKELSDLGRSRFEAFRRSGLLKDLEEAVEYSTRAVSQAPPDHSDLPLWLLRLGTVHDDRYRRLGKLEDLEKSIECEFRALSLTPDDRPEFALRHGHLGMSLGSQFQRLGEIQDLEQVIEHYSCALTLSPEGHPDLIRRHAALGVSYIDRFKRLGGLEDIEKAIEHYSLALALTPDVHPHLLVHHANMGMAYDMRFQRLGDTRDIEQAIQHYSLALALTPESHPDLSGRHANMGAAFSNRFHRLGELGDIEQAIEHYSLALALTPDGYPHLSTRHANLGVAYGNLFQRLGELADIEQAIEHYSLALALTPDGHPGLSARHASLGLAYTDRFQRLGELEDIKQAIEHYSRTLTLTPGGHPDLSACHANLGVAYGNLFHRLGDFGDMEQAMKHYSLALVLTGDDHPDLSAHHANLGVSYTDRFQRLGELGDIDQAIEQFSHALGLTPDGHPDLSVRHANLGISYNDRFQRLGELPDIEKAIENHSRALALTPDDHSCLSARHANMGAAYGNRFQCLGELGDLEQAIEHYSRAHALTPNGHPSLSTRHANLGVAYSNLFQRLGEPRDIEQAIEHYSRALALTPDGHPDLPARQASLGASYADRFQRLGELGDINLAIEHNSGGLCLTPEGHPDLPRQHFNQAIAYFLVYQLTHTQTSLQLSLHHFRNASHGLAGTPHLKFGYASEWARLACSHPELECIEAYQAAITLLPQFIWVGAATKTRYHDLSKADSLAINAAFAAVCHSSYPLAIEWLEHARCVVWNQSLMLRSPLDQLHSSHPELAGSLQTVSSQLYDLGDEPVKSQPIPARSSSLEEIGRRRRRLAQEYSTLLAEARTLPGFEDFLQPMKAIRLGLAAKHGPIVIINCHADRCDALIITPGENEFKWLALPGFNAERARDARSELESSLMQKGIRQRGVNLMQLPGFEDRVARILRDLWTHLVLPILDLLGFLADNSGDNLPHITWCPTGALSFLPLHAAGDYSQPGSRVFDYAISSYTPTLTALLASTPSTLTSSSRVLAIGQAYTPGHTPLPGIGGELESVKGHVQNKAGYTVLMDRQATTSAVLDAMEEHDWVHLACHAHQNINDATKSGFFLHDGTLDLASINRRSFGNKGLAFLSACQTATGDEKLPDEAIHLASGMLMAGYSSVIATMWSVVDKDAPFVADKVYAELMKEGKVGNGEAGKALHHAVAALREQVGEKEFERWVPYIHIGS